MKFGEVIIKEYPVKEARYANGMHLHSYRELRLALLKIVDKCWWCDTTVKDYPDEEGVPRPDDLATIDHLISRMTRKKGEVVEKVLACNKCNNERALKQLNGELP